MWARAEKEREKGNVLAIDAEAFTARRTFFHALERWSFGRTEARGSVDALPIAPASAGGSGGSALLVAPPSSQARVSDAVLCGLTAVDGSTAMTSPTNVDVPIESMPFGREGGKPGKK
jgi:hypothetical protein